MNIGEQVGQYSVTQLLGEGGMGAVYKAVDTMIDREVAIKVLRPEIGRNANLLQRFRAEAVTLAKLNHSGIATLYSFTQHGDEFLMIMEYVPGKTLEAIEQERGRLPVEVAVPLFSRMLEAVGPAHEMGIVHRDIKPANIMLTTYGAVKVMDFGIARIVGAARQTRQGALVGTMEYIAPERVKGSEGGIASDIYSLGIVFFEMLAGRLPFVSSNEYELMRLQLESEPPSLAELGVTVPPAVEAVLRRALAKDPEARFASCEDFEGALREAYGESKISRAEVVALVGKITVQELGTAGHHSSVSGETVRPQFTASAGPVSAPSYTPPRVPAAVAGNGGEGFARKYKMPLIGAAALLLAIGGGVGAGMLSRHSAPKPPVVDPDGSISPTPAPVPAMNQPDGSRPADGGITPIQPSNGDAGQVSPITPVSPVAETPEAPKPAHPAPKKRESQREITLKALDQ